MCVCVCVCVFLSLSLTHTHTLSLCAIPSLTRSLQVPGVNFFNIPAFTTSGDVVLANYTRHTVHVLAAATGAELRCFGSKGAGMMQFTNPFGVCVSRADSLLVADCGNHRVVEVAQVGRAGTAVVLGAGLVQRPCAVALTPAEDGVIVRQQGGANRVVVLARDGSALVRVLLTTADVNSGYCGLGVSRSGVVAVCDYRKQSITLCSVDGAWKRTITAAVLASPLGAVCGAAFDRDERVWVIDRTAGCFVVVAPQ